MQKAVAADCRKPERGPMAFRRLRACIALAALVSFAAGIVWLIEKSRRGSANSEITVRQLRRQAEQAWQKRDFENYVALLSRVPDSSPEKALALAEQAKGYWELNRGLELEDAVKRCLERDPSTVPPSRAKLVAWSVLSDHFSGHERFLELRDVLWKLHNGYAQNGRPTHFFLFQMIKARYQKVAPALAVQRLERFLANDDEDYDSHRAMGIYQFRMGNPQRARQHLHRAVAARPNVARCVESWLEFLHLSGDFAGLERSLAALPEELSDHPTVWVYRGRVLEARQNFAGAAAAYQNALRREPRRLDASNLYCQALRWAGLNSELVKAEPLAKEIADANQFLSLMYGTYRVQSERPSNKHRLQIAKALRSMGEPEEALAWETLP